MYWCTRYFTVIPVLGKLSTVFDILSTDDRAASQERLTFQQIINSLLTGRNQANMVATVLYTSSNSNLQKSLIFKCRLESGSPKPWVSVTSCYFPNLNSGIAVTSFNLPNLILGIRMTYFYHQ